MDGYRLVMFDFDGTLADSFGWFARALREVTPRYRLRPLSDAEYEALRGLDARAIMARLGLPWWKLPMLTRTMRARMREEIADVAMFDGVGQLLADLKAAGLDVAIVTSNSADNVRAVVGERHLAHVDALECGVSIFGKKNRLAKTIARFGRTPAQSLYVGDEIRDAEAAAALGVDFVGVSWGYTTPAALQRHTPLKVCVTTQEIRTIATSARIRHEAPETNVL